MIGANHPAHGRTADESMIDVGLEYALVMALVRWATGERLADRLLELNRILTLSPPSEQRDSWSSYGAVRAYSEVLYNLWGPREND